MEWNVVKWDFLNILLGFILGIISIMIKPLIEKKIIYKFFIDPIEVYPKSRKSENVSRLSLGTTNREGHALSEKFVLINKCNETIFIDKVGFLLGDIKISNGDVTWIYGITDDEFRLDDYLHFQKDWFKKRIHKTDKKTISISGGTTKNLLPIVLEPHKPIKLYSKFFPVIHTKSIPLKIKVKLDLILNSSKNNKQIRLGIFEWRKNSNTNTLYKER